MKANTAREQALIDGEQEQGGHQLSVSEFVEQQRKSKSEALTPIRTVEDREIEIELEKIDVEVAELIVKKRAELSFEVLDEMTEYPELDKVSELIQIAIDNFKIYKKVGKYQEAEDMKSRVKEMKFSKEHLNLVLNLDFNKPSKKLIELAKAANVDLKDANMLEEFKLV